LVNSNDPVLLQSASFPRAATPGVFLSVFKTELTEIHFSFRDDLGESGTEWEKSRIQDKQKKPSISADMPGFFNFFLVLVF
jgi:hypothetical protein